MIEMSWTCIFAPHEDIDPLPHIPIITLQSCFLVQHGCAALPLPCLESARDCSIIPSITILCIHDPYNLINSYASGQSVMAAKQNKAGKLYIMMKQ